MKLTNCAEALRRHHFEAETVKDTTEAFAVLKAIAERERPEIVSFGDSETMHATGIVGWLRGDGRWKLLDGFDPAMSYPERLEIRRQALMSDLFITGVNAISMEGSLHWLDKVGNRIAPVAFGPRKVVIVAGRNKIVADRAQAEDRIRTIAAPQNVARHPGFRTPCARTGVCSDCIARPRVQHAYGDAAVLAAGRVLVVLIDQELGL
ncbi:MAG: lactate utilization protein [Alistipes onderdonkii]